MTTTSLTDRNHDSEVPPSARDFGVDTRKLWLQLQYQL